MRYVGQSFGFAAELPLDPELGVRQVKHSEFIARRVGQKADGGAEAPALQGPNRKACGIRRFRHPVWGCS